MVRRFSKAVTKTRPALQPANRSLSSLRRLPSTGPALVTASMSRSQFLAVWWTMTSGILAAESKVTPSAAKPAVSRVDEFVFGVADVEDHAAGGEGWAEVFDDGLDERILPAGRERDSGAVGQGHWHAGQVTLPGNLVLEAFAAGEVMPQGGRPARECRPCGGARGRTVRSDTPSCRYWSGGWGSSGLRSSRPSSTKNFTASSRMVSRVFGA